MDYNYQQMARNAVKELISRYADPDCGNCYIHLDGTVTFRENDFEIHVAERSYVRINGKSQEVPNSWIVDTIAGTMGSDDHVGAIRERTSDMIARFARARAALRRY